MMQRTKKLLTRPNLFDDLPDDLIVSILCELVSSASCPADFFNVLVSCKRLKRLGFHPLVLSRAGPETLGIRAKNWSVSAHRFLVLCVNAGNVEACYALGMIRFYCLQNRRSGASLMARAALKSHATAMYSLAVILFNGSGDSKNKRNLRAGVALCTRAAFLGHIDALRELGHCVQDGYGVPEDVEQGRRFLIHANARELACALRNSLTQIRYRSDLLSNVGCSALPVKKLHPANRFLREWFKSDRFGPGNVPKLCSYNGCGKPETRVYEFRRCGACRRVYYCSRVCQSLDWRVRHKLECRPREMYPDDGGDAAEIENAAAAG